MGVIVTGVRVIGVRALRTCSASWTLISCPCPFSFSSSSSSFSVGSGVHRENEFGPRGILGVPRTLDALLSCVGGKRLKLGVRDRGGGVCLRHGSSCSSPDANAAVCTNKKDIQFSLGQQVRSTQGV